MYFIIIKKKKKKQTTIPAKGKILSKGRLLIVYHKIKLYTQGSQHQSKN